MNLGPCLDSADVATDFFFFSSFPANAVSAGWRNVLNEMEKSQVWQKCVPVTARICP